jgi:hypothetical protein
LTGPSRLGTADNAKTGEVLPAQGWCEGPVPTEGKPERVTVIGTGFGPLHHGAHFVAESPRRPAAEQRAEVSLKCPERANLLTDFFQMFLCQLLHMTARLSSTRRQGEQRLYFLQGYAQRLRALYKT